MITATATRRLLPVVIALATLLSVGALPTEAVRQPTAPEARMLSHINDARRQMGRVPLYWDARLADVAKARSNDMATNGYFAHLPSGELAAMLAAKNIKWYRLGETIARNSYSDAYRSADVAFNGWRNSSTHWSLLSGVDFNYIAIGMARAANGHHFWTALMIKGPDRTPPVAKMTGAKLGTPSGGRRSVTVSWTGHDVPLSVLTAGLLAAGHARAAWHLHEEIPVESPVYVDSTGSHASIRISAPAGSPARDIVIVPL